MPRKKIQQTPAQKKLTAARKKVVLRTRHLLVPHKANQYRPQLIRAHSIIAVLVLALVVQMAYGYVTTGHLEVLGRASDITTTGLLSDTNAERQKQGEAVLTLNDQLNKAAYLKAQDMIQNGYWAHTSPSGATPWKWLGDVGYNYSTAGENLAKNYPNADATVAAWMASPTHRENILNSAYTDVGFAVIDGSLAGRETTLVVAYYGAPVSAAAASSGNGNSSSNNGANEAVAGAHTSSQAATGILSSVGQTGGSPMAYFASAVQSLSPISVAVLLLLALIAVVGATAHHYRNKLPKEWRQSWRVHHGMYTFWGMIGLGMLIILATGGGSL